MREENLRRLPDVMNRTGLSRSGIYAAVAAGKFPKPIKLGPRAVGWLESEIDAYVERLIILSRGGQPDGAA